MTVPDQSWFIFPTALGYCGIAWSVDGVTQLLLPETYSERIQKELQLATGRKTVTNNLPMWIRLLVKQIKFHMNGKQQDFSTVPVAIDNATNFMRTVYTEAQRIPSGTVISYAQLAQRLGNPGAVRAVGTALGKNPVPLIIPCHRIISASGKLGGFSANGGVAAKEMLLACEGVILEKPRVLTAAHWREAVAFLKRDKLMSKLIKQVGDIEFQPRQNEDPLEVFINAIASQQLSTKAASTILQRINKLVHVNGKPSARKILALPDDTLRAAGLSGMKVSYLKDLAQHSVDKKFPTLQQVKTASDEQLVQRFTAVRGIGRWSVEMYLIFDLGRADVFPVDDLGIRKAVAQLQGLPELPPAKQMAQYGEQWKPYRSVASLYLWRLLDKP